MVGGAAGSRNRAGPPGALRTPLPAGAGRSQAGAAGFRQTSE